MKTSFTPGQLADPDVASSEAILRKCVHCGFCQATCPTYLLLGDELDSPRGRIYQIQQMLESGGPPSPETVKHVDRCLSCLSCMTTCPSGVNYMHLVDHARAHIEETYRRPWPERALRALLSATMSRPRLFRLAARAGAALGWAAPLLPGRLAGVARLAPRRLPEGEIPTRARTHPAEGARRIRVALLSGCVQPALGPQINAAAIRLLTRHGVEVIEDAAGCCGALPHHLGQADRAKALARARIETWSREMAAGGLDAIVLTASGCGTSVKDYGFLFRSDPALAETAAAVAALAVDVSELLERLQLAAAAPEPLTVAYQSPCSMQHGQGVARGPRRLLEAAGFRVVEPREPHICCGSAGTYSLLQPKIAGELRRRKADHLAAVRPDVVASGNLGCMSHLAPALDVPIVHTVELLDWASGGPRPAALAEARVALAGRQPEDRANSSPGG